MKRKLFGLILIAALVLTCGFLEAQAASESGLTFQLNADSYIVSKCDPSAGGALTVPATYNGKPVTGIGAYAFAGCKNLTAVTIPGSVTDIGKSAFDGCTGLTVVTLENGVATIGFSAFAGCENLTMITIPSTVTAIDGYVFYGCKSLKNITIPDSVTTIGDAAFSLCKSLETVTVPGSVTGIGTMAFAGCENLTTINLGKSVKNIGEKAFDGCIGLEYVHYAGNQKQFSQIGMGQGNDLLVNEVTYGAPAEIEKDPASSQVPDVKEESVLVGVKKPAGNQKEESGKTGLLVTVLVAVLVSAVTSSAVTILILKKK